MRRIEAIEAALREMLASDDPTWEERDSGHDWSDAAAHARAALALPPDDGPAPATDARAAAAMLVAAITRVSATVGPEQANAVELAFDEAERVVEALCLTEAEIDAAGGGEGAR